MPRAPPTPSPDAFNLAGASDPISVATGAAAAGPMAGYIPLPYPNFSPPISHPILAINISTYISYKVTTAGANYSKWRQTITSLLTMYKAVDHITEGAAPASPDDTWEAVDLHISLWFLATLSDDLHRLAQGSDGRACTTWMRLRRLFLDRGTSRYLYLSKAFHNCPRGDLTITDYASKLQGLADDLAAIGRPVSDTDLTGAFIDGLGKRFKLQGEILKNADPLPSFAVACARLQHSELDDDTEQLQHASQVMVAHDSDRGQTRAGAGPGQQHTGGGQPRPPGYISPNYKGKNPIPGFVHPGRDRGDGAPPPPGGAHGRGRAPSGGGRGSGDTFMGRGGGQLPWYGYFAPATMPFPPRAWIPPNAHGVLGSRPRPPTQAYPVMDSNVHSTAPPPEPAAATAPGQPTSWDYTTMYQNAPSYGSAFHAPGGDWVMDSGASSHVTGNPANTSTLLASTITSLKTEFSMTDLGDIHHFLGINVHRNTRGLFLCQQQYALEVLDRAGMLNCHPISTPVDTTSKISITTGKPFENPSLYRSLAGALQYLTLTRPDLAYAVQQVCLFMHAPTDAHFQLIKRILRYIRGTSHFGLQLHRASTHDLVAYSDADWAGCPDTRKSTSGFGVFLGSNLVSWSSKRQNTISRSSAEAEYRAVANCVAESCWLRQLLVELHRPPSRATIVYCDNISAVYLSSNPVHHQRTKHVEIDLHFVRDKVALGEARILHVPTGSQYADIFTKGLPTSVFEEFRTSLNITPNNSTILLTLGEASWRDVPLPAAVGAIGNLGSGGLVSVDGTTYWLGKDGGAGKVVSLDLGDERLHASPLPVTTKPGVALTVVHGRLGVALDRNGKTDVWVLEGRRWSRRYEVQLDGLQRLTSPRFAHGKYVLTEKEVTERWRQGSVIYGHRLTEKRSLLLCNVSRSREPAVRGVHGSIDRAFAYVATMEPLSGWE
ncbi:hypothetical protein QYE76_056425 [Lolium multiflorum]|uniref:Reverse transcriptase Ty1/copia-type domain-containing protein n=1 Tax=Lolium multiflorum TaxID=4521 RepID=A0AAD8T1L7_LOLMU|nr:hypothetical protein QYE76_056425 [Lolium multiflorum]